MLCDIPGELASWWTALRLSYGIAHTALDRWSCRVNPALHTHTHTAVSSSLLFSPPNLLNSYSGEGMIAYSSQTLLVVLILL